METVTLPLQALFDPVDAVPRAIQGRAQVVLSTGADGVCRPRFSGAVIAHPTSMRGTGGDFDKPMHERRIAETAANAKSPKPLKRPSGSRWWAPLPQWVDGSFRSRHCIGRGGAAHCRLAAGPQDHVCLPVFSVMSLSLLPAAVFHTIQAVVAFKRTALAAKHVPDLLVTSVAQLVTEAGPHAKLVFAAIDLFNIWAALLLGLGFSAATGLSKPKGVIFGLVIYVLFAALFYVGLPALAAGAHHGPPGGQP